MTQQENQHIRVSESTGAVSALLEAHALHEAAYAALESGDHEKTQWLRATASSMVRASAVDYDEEATRRRIQALWTARQSVVAGGAQEWIEGLFSDYIDAVMKVSKGSLDVVESKASEKGKQNRVN